MAHLSRDEIIELVRKIMNGEFATEAEWRHGMDLLEANVPHPGVSDLIYYPRKGDVTPEEVVEEAMAYQPIPLRDERGG